LLTRTLNIQSKAVGPRHLGLVPTLSMLAEVLRKAGRASEAASLEARAQTIRDTNASK
jgi:hypothetical protein